MSTVSDREVLVYGFAMKDMSSYLQNAFAMSEGKDYTVRRRGASDSDVYLYCFNDDLDKNVVSRARSVARSFNAIAVVFRLPRGKQEENIIRMLAKDSGIKIMDKTSTYASLTRRFGPLVMVEGDAGDVLRLERIAAAAKKNSR